MLDIGECSELWVKDGDNHDTFVVVVIMTEYIVWYILKAITYHHLLLIICTCGTIWGCTTIKINHKNKVICTWIVMHCATIQIYTTNRVNMVSHVRILFLVSLLFVAVINPYSAIKFLSLMYSICMYTLRIPSYMWLIKCLFLLAW